MSNLLSTRTLAITAIVLLETVALIVFFIAYQTGVSIDVIDISLQRHVDQFLIERTTQGIVMRELTTQNLWLWIAGVALNISVVISSTLIARR